MNSKNYFTLHEFLYSDTALTRKIDNFPEDFWVIDNIKEKMLPVLNNLRVAWGGPLKITSGYRSKALNDAIGGVKNSLHLKGLAVDIVPVGESFELFKNFVPLYFEDKSFDQIILEKSGSSQWVHIGIESNEGTQRKQVFGLNLK